MNPIEALTNARSRAVAWPLIVRALRELTKTSSVDSQGRPWIEVAAHLTGYTTNQLHIGQRTFKSIENFIQHHELPFHALEWPMSNLEVITRIAKINPERAKQLICDHKLVSLRDLRAIYEKNREEPDSQISAMSAGHRSARQFGKVLFQNLSDPENLQRILGLEMGAFLGTLKSWPGRYPYVHPDFYVDVKIDGKIHLVAFEGLRFYGDVSSQAAMKVALKTAVESTFFSQYFWCAPRWVDLKDLKILRDELDLRNVGLLSFFEAETTVVSSPSGPPIHDRQFMILNSNSMRSRLEI